jgi:hypothetical protein
MRIRLYFLALCLLAGCAGPYTRIEKPQFTGTDQAYTVDLPVGWVQGSFPQQSDTVSISRDGFGLQSISIYCARHDKAFPKLKKTVSAKMLPSDMAEIQLAEMKANHPNSNSMQVVESTATTIADMKGYRLHVRYLNDKGLRFEQVTYGLVGAQYYYTLSYVAPTLHYFPRDKQVFEQLVKSFHIKT